MLRLVTAGTYAHTVIKSRISKTNVALRRITTHNAQCRFPTAIQT
jgi:hypothetical protein